MQVKIIDVIELPNENRIHVKFVGLDDGGAEITHELNKKFTPNEYKNIEDIKAALSDVVRAQAIPSQAIEDLKKLKGKKFAILNE